MITENLVYYLIKIIRSILLSYLIFIFDEAHKQFSLLISSYLFHLIKSIIIFQDILTFIVFIICVRD